MKTVRILFFGDVVGMPGTLLFQKYAQKLKKEYNAQFVIVNGENSTLQGRGITSRIARSFRHNGADIVTTGNHIWDNREIYEYLSQHTDVLRPENFSSSCPGTGVGFAKVDGLTLGVLNLQGRVFMREHIDCPFKTADSALTYMRSITPLILVDMHAETTAEKMGLAYYLDGRVSAVVGTHTHVPTADERILPNGTAYISDVGMAGALNSMIGMKKEAIIERFMTQMPTKFVVDTEGPFFMCAVCIEIDVTTGKSISIQRIRIDDDTLVVSNGKEHD